MNTAGNYTAADAERAARNPAAFKEDDMPALRFEYDTTKDNEESIKQGRFVHTPKLMVYMRARGDERSEVPYEVEGHRFESKMIEKEVKRPVFRTVQKDGEWVEEEVMHTETIQEEFKFKVPRTEWLDKLNEKKTHNLISQGYYNYCMDALKRFKAGQSEPIQGTPIIGWNQISMAMQKNAVDLGINTIELAAEMTDEAMDALGMGSRQVKKQAKAYITATNVDVSASQMLALQNENERLKDQGDTLSAKFKDLEERIARDEAPKRKPGRPPKQEE
jgi:hypothetical protein